MTMIMIMMMMRKLKFLVSINVITAGERSNAYGSSNVSRKRINTGLTNYNGTDGPMDVEGLINTI